MEQKVIRNNIWNMAGKAALLFAAISSAYLFIDMFFATSELPSVVTTLGSSVIWLAKFGGCIYLMMFYMKKFVSENPQASNSDTFRLGTRISLLSSIIYAAVTFANVAYISTDIFSEMINTSMQQMAPMLDSNSMTALDSVFDRLPQITFFTNLIYCFIYGTVLSFILSRNIPTKDPFADYKPE